MITETHFGKYHKLLSKCNINLDPAMRIVNQAFEDFPAPTERRTVIVLFPPYCSG